MLPVVHVRLVRQGIESTSENFHHHSDRVKERTHLSGISDVAAVIVAVENASFLPLLVVVDPFVFYLYDVVSGGRESLVSFLYFLGASCVPSTSTPTSGL